METFLSVATLAGVLWTAGFLLPRAGREDDAFARVCAVLTTLLALLAWLSMGAVGIR